MLPLPSSAGHLDSSQVSRNLIWRVFSNLVLICTERRNIYHQCLCCRKAHFKRRCYQCLVTISLNGDNYNMLIREGLTAEKWREMQFLMSLLMNDNVRYYSDDLSTGK